MQLNPPPNPSPSPHHPTPHFMMWQPKLNLHEWQRTDDAQELLLQKQSVTACTVTYRAIVTCVCHIHVILRCLSHPCDTEVSITSMWYWGVCHIHVILRCLSHPCDTEVSITSMWYWGVCHIHVILRCHIHVMLRCLSHPCDTEVSVTSMWYWAACCCNWTTDKTQVLHKCNGIPVATSRPSFTFAGSSPVNVLRCLNQLISTIRVCMVLFSFSF